MFKNVFILYIICFGCYVLFTREPDFFESETVTAKVIKIFDSTSKKVKFAAVFNIGTNQYFADVNYLFRNEKENDILNIKYNPDKPSQCSVYSIWGYWLRWQELLISFLLIFATYHLAVSITLNPTPESLIEQSQKDKPQRKYS